MITPSALFNHRTGVWSRPDGTRLGWAWAGNDSNPTWNPNKIHGKLNPEHQALHNIGPIPAGDWVVGEWHDHPTLGPMVATLTPCKGTDALGRDGFYMHGPDRDPVFYGQESRGCVVTPRPVRLKVKDLCPKGSIVRVVS